MSRQVTFTVSEPSESEYLEEYNKLINFSSWFLLIFTLTGVVKFWASLQVGPYQYRSINFLYELISIRNDNGAIYVPLCKRTGSDDEHHHYGIVANDSCQRESLAFELSICSGIGAITGSGIGGILGDLYGRRKISLICINVCLVISYILIFVKTKTALLILSAMLSSFLRVTEILTFINFAEIANRKTRILCIYTLTFWSIGDFVMDYISDRISEWRKLASAIAITNFLALFACWYIPESPRWLLNKNKKKAAFVSLEDISGLRYNFDIRTNREEQKTSLKATCFAMLTYLFTKKLKNFLILTLLTIVSTVFYISGKWRTVLNFIYTDQLSSLSLTMEAASFLFITPVYFFLGKRFGLFLIYILMSICSLTALLSSGNTKTIYFSVFKILFGISTKTLLKAYVIDVFPTFVRATVFGFLKVVESAVTIGGILLIDNIERIGQFRYYFGLATVSMFGSLVLILPATSKQDLPNFKLSVT